MLKRDKDIICFQSKVDTLNLIILDMEDKIKSMEHKLKSSNGNIRIYNYQQQNMDDKERDSNKESEVWENLVETLSGTMSEGGEIWSAWNFCDNKCKKEKTMNKLLIPSMMYLKLLKFVEDI